MNYFLIFNYLSIAVKFEEKIKFNEEKMKNEAMNNFKPSKEQVKFGKD